MPNYTSNIRLTKPLQNEHYDINVHNGNYDMIDTEIQGIKTKNTSQDTEINNIKAKNTQQDTEIQNIKDSVGSIRLEAQNVSIADTGNNFTSTNVEGALTELFQNVDSGKGLIASAITDMGVNTSKNDSFSVMSNNIKSISTGLMNIKCVNSLPSIGDKNTIYVMQNSIPSKVYMHSYSDESIANANGDIHLLTSNVNVNPFPFSSKNISGKINILEVYQNVGSNKSYLESYYYSNGWIKLTKGSVPIYRDSVVNSYLVGDRQSSRGGSKIENGLLKVYGYDQSTQFNFSKSVDFSTYTKLVFVVDSAWVGTLGSGFLTLGLKRTVSATEYIKSHRVSEDYNVGSNVVIELDVSSINESLYINISGSTYVQNSVQTIDFKEIYLVGSGSQRKLSEEGNGNKYINDYNIWCE